MALWHQKDITSDIFSLWAPFCSDCLFHATNFADACCVKMVYVVKYRNLHQQILIMAKRARYFLTETAGTRDNQQRPEQRQRSLMSSNNFNTLNRALRARLGTCCAWKPNFWHTQRDVCQKVGPPAQQLPLPALYGPCSRILRRVPARM